ncbi:hypothetical protein E2C01_088256 [Portunus trituberculatus]|uniref:Uncharacterized protein n=1 Tax=Portunus trituberculatus TaxID=210409 RepID=A0A5B7JEW6_PORTR|nr:hypothetical protein [Portunus trituberculatus]
MSRAVVWRGRAGLDGGQGGGRLARRATHAWPPAWRVAPVRRSRAWPGPATRKAPGRPQGAAGGASLCTTMARDARPPPPSRTGLCVRDTM